MVDSQVIEQMLRAEFYPHPVTLPIDIIQTHISWVFLTGDYAYKLKKSVNFGFLDFSTIDKRRHFLEEELRLNRAAASDIYLEVLQITKDGDSYRLNGAGETVEYVLKMQQFPQEALFVEMFERGRLTPEHLEELGRVVARFHGNCETNDYISSFGEVEQIKKAIDDNYQQTAKYIGRAQSREQYGRTKNFTDRFLQDNRSLFLARIANQKIRECHGDLHLKNICCWHNKIYLFDRIEFNEPFRYVDVIYDVAFTVMDLDAKGRKDLGNIFLNTYLEETGDWEGTQVLPLYLSRQAYVRAKVTSFLLDDPNISEEEKQRAATTASDYYKLAYQYTQKRQGKLILMSGLSGSGKSTVGKKLAQELNGIQIRSDAVRKHLAGIGLQERGNESIYSQEMTTRTYQRLLELGKTLVCRGFTVILDAKYDRRCWREQAIALAKSENIPLEIVYCSAPMEVLCDRLQQRNRDVSDATPELLAAQQAAFEPFTPEEQGYIQGSPDITVQNVP
jgi:aminoglycoside phosphotransferase family enzyme/predicted kinase